MNKKQLEELVKILAKHTGHHEDLLINALWDELAVTPKEAIAAMSQVLNSKTKQP